MTSKNIEETLNSEKAESTNVLKLYGKYVNDVWMEIFKFKSIDSYDSAAVSDLGLKIAETEILPFLSDFLNVIDETTILYYLNVLYYYTAVCNIVK